MRHGTCLAEVILVGHSYAGLVISANQAPERITRLVYLDAMVPRDGESAVDVLPAAQDLIDLALKSDSGWRVPPLPELLPPGLFGVTDPADIAWLRTMLSDQPVRCLQHPVRLDNPAQMWELPTGHDCMITMPVELAELLPKLG